jgi:alpha-maltose-1-phosphate synthase
MRIHFLSEGDPESSVASFSGTSKSIIDHLRHAGHSVIASDVDLYGVARVAAALPLFSPVRARWYVRYHSHRWPAFLRSLNAARRIKESEDVDAVLQIGATFGPRGRSARPYFLYCDSNIRMAERGAATGYSWASQLQPHELADVALRERGIYQNAAGIFTISEYLRQSFIQDFGIHPDRVVTVGAGPNIDPAQWPSTDSRRPRKGAPTILFVGVQFERKGGTVLLEAFRSVRKALPTARLLIVGPKKPIAADPGVEWLGFLRKDSPEGVAALLDAYSAADVFCLPTRYEPFGIAFLEAMFAGLPCIGTHVWAVPEMVWDGETGFLIPPDDAEALADRILLLLRDPDLARKFGAAGLALAKRQFTWQAAAGRMADYMSHYTAGE